MYATHPPLTLVAATLSALLAGPVQAAAAERPTQTRADETLTVLGETYRNTATKTRLDPWRRPRPSRWWRVTPWSSAASAR